MYLLLIFLTLRRISVYEIIDMMASVSDNSLVNKQVQMVNASHPVFMANISLTLKFCLCKMSVLRILCLD